MNSTRIVLFVHLYYRHSPEDLNQFLTLSGGLNYTIVFNLSNESRNNNKATIIDYQKNSGHTLFIIETPNIGKDIGGKLALIDLCLKLNLKTDFYILLHDKKSPHTHLGEIWKNKLLRIIEPGNIDKIIKLFEQDKDIGIICAKEFITNEYDKIKDDFNCTNNSILKELISKYSLNLKTHDFVGGTMFWIRAEIVHSFFKKYSPLDIRATLEKGNVLDHEKGSITHAWERILSWIAIDKGYYIKGI